jgi:type I restriction enzyme S subunit
MNGFGKRQQTSGIPMIVLRLADIEDGKVSFATARRINATTSQVEKYKLRRGDLLALRVNGSPDLVGRLILCQAFVENVLYCDHFIRLRLAIDVSQWLRLYADTERFRKHIEKTKVSSAGQNTISQGTLARFALPLPSEAEQTEICSLLDRAFSSISYAETQIDHGLARAARLRQAILKRAFEGQLV